MPRKGLCPASSDRPIAQGCRFPFPSPVQAAGRDSTYRETCAAVCNVLFYPPAPAAFAGLMYLFVRQKYFVGYLGERTQR